MDRVLKVENIMNKKLLDLTVVEMSNSKFVTNDKLYRFSGNGITLSDLPLDSLIFTGNCKTSVVGFFCYEFVIWEGIDMIGNTKWINIKD